jgi:lipid II:glycine glycyltransferase (peptidoglycan interpeptide bridge formation enzyme)
LRDSTKRNIRNAEREGITIKAGTSGEFMEEFCRLNYLTRKDHGLPPQPLIFFNKVHEHILARNLGHIILAFNKGVAIAGAVFFHSRDTVIYKYGASDRNYRHLRPNNLIMWEAIQSCARMGHKEFSFGRTEPENEGLRQFKNGWGTDEKILNYVTYDIKRNRFVDRSLSVAQNSRCFGLQRKIFRHMPIALAKIVGKVLYRHVG